MSRTGFHHLDLTHSWRWPDQRLKSWYCVIGNERCFECSSPLAPRDAWVSVTYAISLCCKCAGLHRALGSHLSVIRSISLDAWTDCEVERVAGGGNVVCRKALLISQLGNTGLCVDALRARCESVESQTYVMQLGPGFASGFAMRGEEVQARPGGEEDRTRPCADWLSLISYKFDHSWMTNFFNCKRNSIFECAEAGDVAEVERWISDGQVSLCDVDEHGWTSLHYAAAFGKADVCTLLLRLASARNMSAMVADRPEQRGFGWTPLHYAAQNDHSECVRVLLEAGAAPDPLSHNGKTPLRLASYQNKGCLKVVELLLGYGADPRLVSASAGVRRELLGCAAECWARFAWQRRRGIFLIRDKAVVATGPEAKLNRLLQERPTVFYTIASFL